MFIDYAELMAEEELQRGLQDIRKKITRLKLSGEKE